MLRSVWSFTTPHNFSQLLRRHRLIAGLSQEALAERAGLSTRGISDLERGVRRAPHPATRARLADALGLAPAARQALALAGHPAARVAPARQVFTTFLRASSRPYRLGSTR